MQHSAAPSQCCLLPNSLQPTPAGRRRRRRTHVDLQVLSGAGQAQGVEAAVAGQAAIQPGRALSVGQPEGIACKGGRRGRSGGRAGAAAQCSQRACSPVSTIYRSRRDQARAEEGPEPQGGASIWAR